MKATILNGKSLAIKTEEHIKEEVNKLKTHNIVPQLATILVGHDPASETYVKMKQNTCNRVGMKSMAIELPESTSTEELLNVIQKLNEDDICIEPRSRRLTRERALSAERVPLDR